MLAFGGQEETRAYQNMGLEGFMNSGTVSRRSELVIVDVSAATPVRGHPYD